MSWINIVWPMLAAACLTLALIHFGIWLRLRKQYAYLTFSILALTIAVLAAFEWLLMRAQTVQSYAAVVHWLHVPLFIGVVSVVVFLRFYYRAGNVLLAYTVCISRFAMVLLNFTQGVSINWLQITSLHSLQTFGETVTVADGIPNPMSHVDAVNNVLLLLFILSACVEVWRRRDPEQRRSIAFVGGSLVFLVVVAAGIAFVVHAELLRIPYLISLPFVPVLAAMSFELTSDALRAAQLASRLQVSETRVVLSERRMDLAASAAGLALWEWGAARDEVWTNDQGRRMFGFARNERIDLDKFLGRVHSEDREGVRAAVTQSLQSGGEYEREFRITTPDGGIRWIASRGRVELDSAKSPALLHGVSFDVTERRRLELEAAHQRDELTHLSRVAMLGELSGSLAHELNQPLGAILSNAQAAQRYLKRDPAPVDEIREILAAIVENDKRAGEVIRRLRMLLKKEESQHHPVDVNELIQDVLRLMRSDLLNRRVTIDTHLKSGLPKIKGDQVQLQQVLLNLVMNGCDAMDAATDRRALALTTSVAEDGSVEVSVADRGSGISAAELERIFEPFVTTKENGMGLGLAICRTIIRGHGGRMWATNNNDRGATLHFTVPATT